MAHGPLRAGAAQTCITPHLGCHLDGHFTDRVSDEVHDDLFAKAVVLDNGETRLGIVCCDLIIVTREMTEAVKARVAEQAGIPPDHLLVTATHTHYGPAVAGAFLTEPEVEYRERVPARIAEAVVLAARRLRPAQLGWAFGECPTEVHNRRWHMRDGSVRMNPGYLNPDAIRPVGPTDPTLSLLVLRDEARRPIAALGNLALHYVGSRNTDISSDYFGEFGRALQRCAGAEFVAIMTNGCFGDVNNVDFGRAAPAAPHPYYRLERVANVCAGEAWKAWNTLWEEDYQSAPVLGAALEWVELAPRRPTPEQLVEAERYLAEHSLSEDLSRYAYAREHVLMADMPERMSLPIQALRIGDTALVGLPGEVFAEVGLELRQRSPFAHTVPVGLANDTIGYVAPDYQMDLGGYEVTLCRHVIAPKGTAALWTETALALLSRLHG